MRLLYRYYSGPGAFEAAAIELHPEKLSRQAELPRASCQGVHRASPLTKRFTRRTRIGNSHLLAWTGIACQKTRQMQVGSVDLLNRIDHIAE